MIARKTFHSQMRFATFWHKVLCFLRKFSHACRVNRCLKYHTCNDTLRCWKITSRRILQFFCHDYLEDLLAPISVAKKFGFLAGVVSKIFAIKNALQSKNQFSRNSFGKSLFLTSTCHNNSAQQLDSRNRIHVLCKCSVFAKQYILQFFFLS